MGREGAEQKKKKYLKEANASCAHHIVATIVWKS